MSNIYGEQYVFTDADIRTIRMTPVTKDKMTKDYYDDLEKGDGTTFPTGVQPGVEDKWSKSAMCHSDVVDFGVDGAWIKASPLNVSPDGTFNQNLNIPNGFMLYHNQIELVEGQDHIKIQKEKFESSPTQFDYGESFTLYSATVDDAGHIEEVTTQSFEMPGIRDSLPGNGWSDDSFKNETKPVSAKVIAPAIADLQTDVSSLEKRVNGKDGYDYTGDKGLLERVQVIEDNVTSETNSQSHIKRIQNIEKEIGITGNTHKPGLEFDSDTKLRFKPIDIIDNQFVKPGSGGTVFNHYSNAEEPIANQENLYYLENTNKVYGVDSIASGRYTQAIGNYSNASGYATYAVAAQSHAEGRGFFSKGQNDKLPDYNVLKITKTTLIEDKTKIEFTVNEEQLTAFANEIKDIYNFDSYSRPLIILNNSYVGIVLNNKYTIFPLYDSETDRETKGSVNLDRHTITVDPADDITITDYENYTGYLYFHVGGAYGTRAHVENFSTTAKDSDTHAEGRFSMAIGQGSHAQNGYTRAIGEYSHAEGKFGTARGESSHSEGYSTEAVGAYSHAEGNNSSADGIGSHAEGYKTAASEEYSHAEGYETVASGKYAHAEGGPSGNADVKASGQGSHAEGGGCHAEGAYAHAEGQQTKAKGVASHSGGYFTEAKEDYQTAIGKYNAANKNALFIVGNGSEGNLSNAFVVKSTAASGAEAISGKFISEGADYAEYFEWNDKNPLDEDRIGYFVTLNNADNILIAKKDSEIIGVISASASIIGDSQELAWQHKYLKDVYGRVEYDIKKDENGEIIKTPKLNPLYNPDLEYVPRSERPEWDIVGMLGKLIVRDDGSCIPGKYCTSNNAGIATASTTGYRVLKRLDESHIQILFK